MNHKGEYTRFEKVQMSIHERILKNSFIGAYVPPSNIHFKFKLDEYETGGDYL